MKDVVPESVKAIVVQALHLLWRKGAAMAKKSGVSGKTHSQQQLNAYANQHNPNNKAYIANQLNHENQIRENAIRRARRYDIGILDGESYGWCDD